MENRQPRFKQLAFPQEIGCGLAGGDWPTYKEMITVFAHRSRDIKVDMLMTRKVIQRIHLMDPTKINPRIPMIRMNKIVMTKNGVLRKIWRMTTKKIIMVKMEDRTRA